MNSFASVSVLCVDDDPDTREVLSLLLRREGYVVVTASDAEEGLELLRSRHFDLVISDYALPRFTGTWMLNRARSLGLLSGTKALLFTADDRAERPEGTVGVLFKPLDMGRLLRRVSEALGRDQQKRAGRMPSLSGEETAVTGDDDGAADLVLEVSLPRTSSESVNELRRVLGQASQVRLVVKLVEGTNDEAHHDAAMVITARAPGSQARAGAQESTKLVLHVTGEASLEAAVHEPRQRKAGIRKLA